MFSEETVRDRTKMTTFTYHRVPRRADSAKEWIRKERTIRPLHWIRFLPQSHCLSADADDSGWVPLHRRLPLPLLGRYRFRVLAQILVRLAGVDPSKKLVLQLRRLYPLLPRNFRLLQREGPVVEANSSSRPPPHWDWAPFLPVWVFSPSADA